MKEVLRRRLGAVRGLVRGLVSELAGAEWVLHALPNTEELSLRDEVWRCPVGKSGYEPERSEQRETAKLHRDTSASSSCHRQYTKNFVHRVRLQPIP